MVKPRVSSKSLLWSWPLLVTVVAATVATLSAPQQGPREHDSIVVGTTVTSDPTPPPLPQVGLPIDQTRVGLPVKDATGDIWAMHYGKGIPLFKWDGKAWRPYPFKPIEGSSAVRSVRGEDGAALCLWNFNSFEKPDKDLLLSYHQGKESRVLARWKAQVSGDTELFQTKHAIWTTSNGEQIHRVQNGSAHLVYRITRRQMHSGAPHTTDDYNNALQVVEDSSGHTYFWTNELNRGFRNLSLRGILEFDGQKWTHHPHINGLPNKPYTAFVEHSPHSFWIAVGDVGLFDLDTLTWTAKRIADPIPYAFEGVQKIQQVGNVWYLLSDAPEVRYPRGDYSQRQSDLYRWQDSPSGGHFERILRGLDYDGDFSSRADRPLLATPTGLWIGANSGGAWWMPFDKMRPPVHLDWRRGLLLSDIVTLTLQRDGRIMASAWSGTIPDLRAYLTLAPVTAPSFTAYGSIIEDTRHHLWRVPNLSQRVLMEWDGLRWRTYPIPASYRLNSLFYLSADRRGRIWLLPDDTSEKVALLQPATGSWQFFPSFAQALQQQLNTLGAAELARIHIGSGNYFVPAFASKNRIAFRAPGMKVFFFDGHQWHTWTLNAITGQKRLTEDNWDERPYFTPSGTLSANIIDHTWRWMPPRGWKSGDMLPFPLAPKPVLLPPGSGFSDIYSPVRDSSGAVWFSKDRQLYKAQWGLCEPQLAPTQRHPLRDGRGIGAVLLDPRGVPLLATGTEDNYEYIWAPHSPPDTGLSATPQGSDAFHLSFVAMPNNKEKHWFRWRLDAGKWSPPQLQSTLSLDFVPSGVHRFEVATIDARLQLDPTPATTTLTVHLASNQQLTRFLSMLSSPDYAQREKAVKAFAQQKEKALPFLRAARKTADSDLRWWIDAALQEIERQSPS